MSLPDIVFIKNLKIEAIIGIYAHERTQKQPIHLNIEMAWDNTLAANSEDISLALDYEAVTNDLKKFVAESQFLLVETLAEAIAQRLINTFHTPSVLIELHKPEAITDTDAVGVRIFRQRKLPQ